MATFIVHEVVTTPAADSRYVITDGIAYDRITGAFLNASEIVPAEPLPITPAYRKEIQYDRKTRDYAMYLDGKLVGFARTYQEAETTLDQLVFELLNHPTTVIDAINARIETEATSADMDAEMAGFDADEIEMFAVVEALAAEIGTNDLHVARGLLAGSLANYAADWDEWAYAFQAPAYRQIGAA